MSEYDDEIRTKAAAFAEAKTELVRAEDEARRARDRVTALQKRVDEAAAAMAKTVGNNIQERHIVVPQLGLVHVKYHPGAGPGKNDSANVRLLTEVL